MTLQQRIRRNDDFANWESQDDFFNRAVLKACRPMLAAAIAFFIVVMAHLAVTVHTSELGLLLLQKGVFCLILIYTSYRLDLSRPPLASASYVAIGILGLCLSSVSITALAGIQAHFMENIFVLFVATSLIEIRLSWASAHWFAYWVAWLTVSGALHSPGVLSQSILPVCGFQAVSIAALLLRKQVATEQYELLTKTVLQGQELSVALQESENSRILLDQRVEERTRQLGATIEELRLSFQEREMILREREALQEELVQSQKMESLGRLAGGVAHDFNNLLTVVLGNLELVRTTEQGSEDWLDHINEAELATRRAAEVTSGLLAFSRKQIMQVEKFGMGALLRESESQIKQLVGQNIAVEIEAPETDIVVEGDKSRMRQVLLNFAVNSRDAMPNGGTFKLSVTSEDDLAVLRVEDNGCGIDPALHDRIFEPFFTTKKVGEGTGLGLSTVLGIISQHKGKIEVESGSGAGTTFYVYLPRVDRKPAFPESENLSSAHRNPVLGTILLVEDEDQLRKFVARVLNSSGYQVVTARNGERAIEVMEKGIHKIDLLITDVVMPGIDGAKLANTLRVGSPELPVLFMSGYTDDKLDQIGVEREDNFLSKPFTPQELADAVLGALGKTPVGVGI